MHPPDEDATDRLSHISVRGMAFDGRYLILGPTARGMWLYDPRSDRFRRPIFATDSVRAAMDREFVSGIVPLSDGNFFVCARHHTYLLEGKSYRLRQAGRTSEEATEESKPAIAPTGSEGKRSRAKPAIAPTGSDPVKTDADMLKD